MILSAPRLPGVLGAKTIQWLYGLLPACCTEKVKHSSERELEIKNEEANGTGATSLDELPLC